MFCFIDKENRLCLRLSSEDKADFQDKINPIDCLQHGRVMKDYVVVSAELLSNEDELRSWYAKSWSNAQALKPKPTKKK